MLSDEYMVRRLNAGAMLWRAGDAKKRRDPMLFQLASSILLTPSQALAQTARFQIIPGTPALAYRQR
jgi:hypothetical protein